MNTSNVESDITFPGARRLLEITLNCVDENQQLVSETVFVNNPSIFLEPDEELVVHDGALYSKRKGKRKVSLVYNHDDPDVFVVDFHASYMM